MDKYILGLDIGSNSIGWALLASKNGKLDRIISLGSRIFIKAVEEKTPTPKNVNRRDARLNRRVIQRRARRKQRMQNYLVSLNLLPEALQGHTQPEIILNEQGDPYVLRARALDYPLTSFELGRVLLHLVQRRGFLSNRKTLLGDMADDPDVLDVLNELEDEQDDASERAKEETAFKKDISALRDNIKKANCRTLGEYLAKFDRHDCKRNRNHSGGQLRTDRQMYREELDLIWEQQQKHHPHLTENIKEEIEKIIFYQRPLKLKSDRIGTCSLEPSRKRVRIARLEYQRFRYLQDINNLTYFDPWQEKEIKLSDEQREKLTRLFEYTASITFAKIRKTLGLDKKHEFNLERGNKKLKGNITACTIRKILSAWDDYSDKKQRDLVEDLLTIQKKSVLKKRLTNFWQYPTDLAVKLCLLDFEPDHGHLSLKAINQLLPYLKQGQIYSDARVSAGYGYEIKAHDTMDRLGMPPKTANPIVNKALNELRRLVNAIIAEYKKPDIIRVEMARDLEMNTKRYKGFEAQQKKNTKANDEAVNKYCEMAQKNPHLHLSRYPDRQDKLKYRLWKDQDERCVYSGESISLSTLFSAEIEVDHILPYSQSLDDAYMNKVVCYANENRIKGQRTPIDAFGGDNDKWDQITQRISRWPKELKSKRERFYQGASDVQNRDFINSQLNDTRYICRVALDYLKPLGADITTSKGSITAWLRHQWGLNNLIGNSNEKKPENDKQGKKRSDHRHHAIDAVVTACVDRSFYTTLVAVAKEYERNHPELKIKDLVVDPPWPSLREDLDNKLKEVIVAHASQRKFNGALHEETGVGFIKGIGNVSRKRLEGDFSQVDKIYDDTVREIVQAHLAKYDNKPKEAFAENITVYHRDGKTPIKRVRIKQSDTTQKKLEKTKFGVKNKAGQVFKWLAYGNMHHMEIIKNKKTGRYSGLLVTMMEANQRAKGISIPKQPIIKMNHGEEYEFIMALHINDLVSVEKNDNRHFYRIRKLGTLGNQPRPTLNLHIDAKVGLTEFSDSIQNLMTTWKLQLHNVNVIGKLND